MDFNTFSRKVLIHSGLPFPYDDDFDSNRYHFAGYAPAKDLAEGLVATIREHVKTTDYFLSQLEYGSEEYIKTMDNRLITFEEYEVLMNGGISEEYYSQFRAFEFCMLRDDSDRRNFIAGKTNDTQGYLQTVEAFGTYLTKFFFESLPVFLPMKNKAGSLFHTYILGTTGAGKSELLKTMIYGLIKKTEKHRDASVILIDPHGDISRELFNLKQDRERLVYFSPYLQTGYTPTINPFELKDKDERSVNIATQNLTAIFKELMADSSLTLQMEAVLQPCISAILRMEGTDMRDLQRFMNEDGNEDLIAEGLSFPYHRAFFKEKFMSQRYKITKDSLYTKIQSLLGIPTFANLTLGKGTVDLEDAVNSGKVMLFSFGEGVTRETGGAYSKFLVAYLQTLIQKRAMIPKSRRKPVYLFIDEIQYCITPSIEVILTEARKYGLVLIASHQTIEQIDSPKLSNILFSNSKVLMVGMNNWKQHAKVSKEIGFPTETLKGMPDYHFAVGGIGIKSPFIFKSNNSLSQKASSFLLKRRDQKKLREYFIKESGYYKKVGDWFEDEGGVDTNISDTSPREDSDSDKPKYGKF